MVRQSHRHNRPFPAITGTLLIVPICLITLLFTACGTEEASPTPIESTQSTVKTTPFPEESKPIETETVPEKTTPATQEVTSVEYPWKSMIAHEGYLSLNVKISGYYLEVSFDFGKELPDAESAALRNKITLRDKNGNEYESFSFSSGGGRVITRYDAEGNVIFKWSADYAYEFGFTVKSKTTDFTLVWNGYPPLDIGNPFETPFLMESG